MSNVQAPLKFSQVVWSAAIILVVGSVLSLFVGDWTWFGSLGFWSIPLGAALGAAIYSISYLLSTLPKLVSASLRDLLQTLHHLFQDLSWLQIVILSLLAGIGEEMLIRGVMQSWLVSVTNPWIGIIGASLIFGLLHYMTKTYVLLTFALGMLFGLAFHFSNSLLLVMIAHTVYDIFAFALIVKFPHMLGLSAQSSKISVIRESSF